MKHSLHEYEYYGQYPIRHKHHISYWVKERTVLLSITGSISITSYLWFAYMDGPWFLAIICTIIGVIFLLFLMPVPSLLVTVFSGKEFFVAKITPYFDKRIGEIDTFGSGRAIAKNCKDLDRLAIERNLEPISAFGFNDDFRNEEVVWHDPVDGICTVSGILKALYADGTAHHERVIDELQRVEVALKKAKGKEARFCFILREGGYTNAQEHEIRKGSFF